MRWLFRLLTAFDYITPLGKTWEDVEHGFRGHHLFVSEENLEEVEAVLTDAGIDLWSNERYGPASNEASVTVSNDDYQLALWALGMCGFEVTD